MVLYNEKRYLSYFHDYFTLSFFVFIGHFEVVSETGSVLCRIALWECFGGRILTQYPVRPRNPIQYKKKVP